MTKAQILSALGIASVRTLADSVVIEMVSGSARPATPLEIRALHLLLDELAITS